MNLKQLAARLNLSPTTVSRALNGYPEVSAETRARVQRAAAEAQYRPNPRALGLATGRAMAIGHVLPIASRTEIVNPIFGDFFAGAGEIYRGAGYDVVLSVVDDSAETDAYAQMAARRAVDGVIVHAPRVRDPRIERLQALGLPFVVHGQAQQDGAPYAFVDMDNRRAFARATERLLALGHRRIALLNGQDGLDFAERRKRGYLQALERAGIAPDPALIRGAEMTELFGHDAATELLAASDPPTAFLTSSLATAFGVRRAADALGLRLGERLALVTHDDDLSYFPNGHPQRPVFAATRSSVREAGRRAAGMLLGLIRGGPDAPRTGLMLEAEQIDGPSLCPGPVPPHSPPPHSPPRETTQ